MQDPQSRSDWLQLGFWLGVGILIIAAGMLIAWQLLSRSRISDECPSEYWIADPAPHAFLFINQLQEDGLIPQLHPNAVIDNFGWYFDAGRVEFVVILEGSRWSGIPCYFEDGVIFQEIIAESLTIAQP